MIRQIAIIFALCSLKPPASSSLDISAQGSSIILQHDIEAILITTDLAPYREQLHDIARGIRIIKQNLVSDVRNTLVKDQKAVNRAMLNSIRTDELNLKFITAQLDSLLTAKAKSPKDKRALEILGSFLSTMTGVPSARDHRKF